MNFATPRPDLGARGGGIHGRAAAEDSPGTEVILTFSGKVDVLPLRDAFPDHSDIKAP